MRGIISICLVVIGMSLLTQKPDLKPRPNPVPFRFHPTHIQYIQDSIQRPIPQHQIRIMVHQYLEWSKIAGTTHRITDNDYLIQLNRLYIRDYWKTTHHELVHVKQMVKQHLHLNPETQQWSWHGKPIDWQLPYKQRPWESEASKEADQIERTHAIKPITK